MDPGNRASLEAGPGFRVREAEATAEAGLEQVPRGETRHSVERPGTAGMPFLAIGVSGATGTGSRGLTTCF